MQTSPKKFIFFVSLFCGLLFIGISVPLITGAVEPNHYYGFRLDKAFESEEMWYTINRYGGKALVAASGLMILANVVLYAFRKKLSNQQYVFFFLGIFLICILVSTFITTLYINSLG